ncbi:CRTAC1 family protein [Pelagicoccus mobilis]|uniref:CRTAC1 family protein n=1 Tax=Pelagicoccus mobilis TaxID=415221 RepID=A0A934VP50_9BACT|nr:CRTAC1 family protein [Pelagicoccus mobilis]MBK1875450.1 CRTAC1 family protein [Pelagicoccus mobilis]
MTNLPLFTACTLACLSLLSSVSGSDLLSLINDRKEKEMSTWRQESLAQEHEEVFIRLWDDLRNSSEPISVLQTFPFNTLKLGELSTPAPLNHGITSQTIGQAERSLPQKHWSGWLGQLQELGYSLYQSEWHHKKFDEKPSGQNESIFSFSLHVEHQASQLRLIADGRIKVVWLKEKNKDGIYVPDTIEVTELEILQRQGLPLFKRLGAFDIAPQKRGPILVHDLNGDGRSEIILPAANQVAWNNPENEYILNPFTSAEVKTVRSALLGDFNADGNMDMIIEGSIYPNKNSPLAIGLLLFQGTAKGGFLKMPKPIDVGSKAVIQGDTTMSCGDIDGDGDLDLWIGQYKAPYAGGAMPTPYYDANDGYPSFLLINEGDGLRFTECAATRGLKEKLHRRVYSGSFVDYDNDSDLDLLVVSDFSGVDLFRNKGNGYFEDVTAEAIEERASFGMGHSFGDFNHDGFLDMYVIGMSSTTAGRLHQMGLGPEKFDDLTNMRIPMTYGNRLYYSQGDGTFKQPEVNDQVARTGWSWGVVTVDFDNDGNLDFYVANGHDSNTTSRDYCSSYWTDDIYRGSSSESPLFDDYFSEKLGIKEDGGISWNGFEHNFLFMPMSDGSTRNLSFLAGVALENDSRMVIADDVNLDGKLDLIIDSNPPNWNPQTQGNIVEVYLNQMPSTGNFIGVRLQDKAGAPSSTAAKIVISTGGQIQAAANVNGDSYESQHAATKHFGIGENDTVDYIEVTWMDGSKRRIENPTVNQYHLIEL